MRVHVAVQTWLSNPHSDEEKLIAALDHPLPACRVRACCLIGLNEVQAAASKLMSLVEGKVFVEPETGSG